MTKRKNFIRRAMVENSNEEYIENAEHFINSIKTDKEYKEENGWHGYYNKEIVELARILEHILQDYKRVLKENEQLRTEVNSLKKENEELKEDRDKFKKALGKRITYCNELEKDLFENCSNYVIPIQKVKDKIKEIDKKIKYEENERVVIYLHKQKNILQEMLFLL